MYICVYVCMYVCVYVCTYVCMYVHTYVHTYVCMYVYVWVGEFGRDVCDCIVLTACLPGKADPSHHNGLFGL